MLVLTRKRDESIKIGSNIVIRVMKTAKGSVKIGIDAPDSMRILRGEVATLEDKGTSVEFDPTDVNQIDECIFEGMLVQS